MSFHAGQSNVDIRGRLNWYEWCIERMIVIVERYVTARIWFLCWAIVNEWQGHIHGTLWTIESISKMVLEAAFKQFHKIIDIYVVGFIAFLRFSFSLIVFFLNWWCCCFLFVPLFLLTPHTGVSIFIKINQNTFAYGTFQIKMMNSDGSAPPDDQQMISESDRENFIGRL